MKSSVFVAVAFFGLFSRGVNATSHMATPPGEEEALLYSDVILVGTPTGRQSLMQREVCATSRGATVCHDQEATLVEVIVDDVLVGDTTPANAIWVTDLQVQERAILFLFADPGVDLDHPQRSDELFSVAYGTLLSAADEGSLALGLSFIEVMTGELYVSPSDALEAYASEESSASDAE